jgi:hypothetical protein
MVSPYMLMVDGVYINAPEKSLEHRICDLDKDFSRIIDSISRASTKNNQQKKQELETAILYLIDELNKLP